MNNMSSAKAKNKYTTKEQLEFAVDEVLRAKKAGKGSHYKVLDIPTNASHTDVKRAYHKKILKLHPDKNKADKASEAFRTATLAYEVLKSPTKRDVYDRNNVTSDASSVPRSTATDSSSVHPFTPGSSSFNTIPAGTRVARNDLEPTSHIYRQQGTVQSFNTQTGKYRVMMGESIVEVEPSALCQNINAELRDISPYYNLGARSVTLWYSEGLGFYEAIYEWDGAQRHTLLEFFEFIIPNGTIVRLDGLEQKTSYKGMYGKVVDWVKRTQNDGVDTSYYDIQMSSATTIRVKMANVRL